MTSIYHFTLYCYYYYHYFHFSRSITITITIKLLLLPITITYYYIPCLVAILLNIICDANYVSYIIFNISFSRLYSVKKDKIKYLGLSLRLVVYTGITLGVNKLVSNMCTRFYSCVVYYQPFNRQIIQSEFSPT